MQRMVTVLREIISNNKAEDTISGLEMFHRLISNTAGNTEFKYQKIKFTNPKVASTVMTLKGGIEELFDVFEFEQIDEDYYLFSGDISELNQKKALLEKVI